MSVTESSDPGERELTNDLRTVLSSNAQSVQRASTEVFLGADGTGAGMGIVVEGTVVAGAAQRGALVRFIEQLRAVAVDEATQPVGLLVFAEPIDDSALAATFDAMHADNAATPALVVPLTRVQAGRIVDSSTTLWQFLDEAAALVAVAVDRPESDHANAAGELLDLLDDLVDRATAARDEASRGPRATLVHRVLAPKPISSLNAYLKARGGVGLQIARRVEPEALIDELEAAGLRGRGGAGFPTHVKWRTVRANTSDFEGTSVVVNGAEGEPGTFKDRTILLNNPYQVIEGALIAARAVGASHVIFGLKESFAPQVERLRSAIAEVEAAGWTEGVVLSVFEGPNEYLYGEETALLETIDGRYPFPRVAPPFRRGVDEVVESAADVGTRGGSSAHVEMAGPSDEAVAPPTLVDNVETMANVPRIISRGGAWFRTEGTDASPGTIVCTITGSTAHAGVGEVIMGTTLREAIELIGGGPADGRRIKAAMSGVANGLLTGDALDTPLTYEDMAAAGSGLGSAGFVVFDDDDDLVAAIAGVSRFLAVESCGQCTPCKQDGTRISNVLARLSENEADDRDLAAVDRALENIDRGARCYLATQHQVVVRSLLEHFPDEVSAHLTKAATPTTAGLTAELTGIAGGIATVDERHRDKQPDWTYGPTDSGQSPAERFGEHGGQQRLPE